MPPKKTSFNPQQNSFFPIGGVNALSPHTKADPGSGQRSPVLLPPLPLCGPPEPLPSYLPRLFEKRNALRAETLPPPPIPVMTERIENPNKDQVEAVPNKVPPINMEPVLAEKPEGKMDEESLEKLPISDTCAKRFQGNSYIYRNVYKSIMRNMNSYVRYNRIEIVRILGKEGYDRTAMEHAFLKLQDYNFREHKQGGNKMAQEVIKRILSKQNIYAFILREAAHAMLENGRIGKIGRVAEKNTPCYLTAVGIIYEEAVNIVGGKEAEGTSFVL